MNSLNMIFFEHNMEMLEVERSYISNMINLEYSGGVLNEDTEIVYEGVLETIKNAILAVLRKIRELFESVIDFFRRKKNTEEDKKVEEVAKKAEENLKKSSGNGNNNTPVEKEKVYIRPVLFRNVSEDSLDFLESGNAIKELSDALDNILHDEDFTADIIIEMKKESVREYNKASYEAINGLKDNFKKNGFEFKSNKYQEPVYKDNNVINDIKNSYMQEKELEGNITKDKLSELLKKHMNFFNDINKIDKMLNPLKISGAKIKTLEKKIESSANRNMSDEISKKMNILKQFVNEFSLCTQFVVKMATTVSLCEKSNIKYNINSIFRMSKILS